MNRYKYDLEYMNIVSDILSNEEFMKMSDIVHHKKNRLDHSIRVSYHSYNIAKTFGLDYVSVARGALLHDFFQEETANMKISKRIKLLFKHPKIALKNSNRHFDLNYLEEDIIVSHMFPVGIRVPRYLESWIVDAVDDVSAVYEKINNGYRKLKLIIGN